MPTARKATASNSRKKPTAPVRAARKGTKKAAKKSASEAGSAAPASASPPRASKRAKDRFSEIGAYGFARQQTAILAALVTEDPLLLIGQSGTGKTFLLNSISEALGLEHRHYNASLISFDDLVGFPYPDDARESVRFLETPATVWSAESVLIDEISRCKPEHQNRLFSLVHERCVQGLPLEKLRYRWAAMNPCTADQDGAEDYLGSEPLDPALADRFAVIVHVGDWSDLAHAAQRLIAAPAGEGVRADDGGQLRRDIAAWRGEFLRQLEACPDEIVDYVCNVVTTLGHADIRLSPRRARLLTRTLLAAGIIVGGGPGERTFLEILRCSLPHSAWGEAPPAATIAAAHKAAWAASLLPAGEQWLHQFHMAHSLHRKTRLLLEHCPSADAGSLAVEQLIAKESKERAAAFAFALYPAALRGKLPIGREGTADLGRIASGLLQVEGELRWNERASAANGQPPELTRLAQVASQLEGARKERAQQLFYWCLVNKRVLERPDLFERDFHRCVELVAERIAS